MFSYLLGNVNGLVVQLNYDENMKSQQLEQLEVWLLKIDRAGKDKRSNFSSKGLSNAKCDFISNYLKTYWSKNIKGLDTDNEFILQLSPGLRTKVY